MTTLYAIEEEFRALDEVLDEHEGDITGCEAIIAHWLEELGNALDKKADGYAAFMAELSARAEAKRDEAKRLTDRAVVDENKVARLKAAMKWLLENRQIKKLETKRFTFTVAGNGGKAPLEVTATVDTLPVDLVKVVRSPDNDAIRARLEAGDAVPGCTLLPRGSHLRVR